MLWKEVLDDEQYETTHYYYSEIRGDSTSTKNYNNEVNKFSLPFVDFRKAVGRNSIKKDSIIYLQSMLIPKNMSTMGKEEDKKTVPGFKM